MTQQLKNMWNSSQSFKQLQRQKQISSYDPNTHTFSQNQTINQKFQFMDKQALQPKPYKQQQTPTFNRSYPMRQQKVQKHAKTSVPVPHKTDKQIYQNEQKYKSKQSNIYKSSPPNKSSPPGKQSYTNKQSPYYQPINTKQSLNFKDSLYLNKQSLINANKISSSINSNKKLQKSLNINIKSTNRQLISSKEYQNKIIQRDWQPQFPQFQQQQSIALQQQQQQYIQSPVTKNNQMMNSIGINKQSQKIFKVDFGSNDNQGIQVTNYRKNTQPSIKNLYEENKKHQKERISNSHNRQNYKNRQNLKNNNKKQSSFQQGNANSNSFPEQPTSSNKTYQKQSMQFPMFSTQRDMNKLSNLFIQSMLKQDTKRLKKVNNTNLQLKSICKQIIALLRNDSKNKQRKVYDEIIVKEIYKIINNYEKKKKSNNVEKNGSGKDIQ